MSSFRVVAFRSLITKASPQRNAKGMHLRGITHKIKRFTKPLGPTSEYFHTSHCRKWIIEMQIEGGP